MASMLLQIPRITPFTRSFFPIGSPLWWTAAVSSTITWVSQVGWVGWC